jgi:hypothetical protein
VTPSWPDDPETVAEARANPGVFAKKTLGQVADHTAEVIGWLEKKPAVIGHSTGGLLAQIIADLGLSAATVAIDPGPFRGVLPLPISALRAASPVLRNPLDRGRAIALTVDEFKYGWANALDDEEAERLYATYHVATPGVALMQMANANLNPRTDAKLDPKNPARGPLLSSRERRTTRCRGRSQTHRPSASDTARRSPRSKRSPTRSLPHHRQRLARGGRTGARVRQALRWGHYRRAPFPGPASSFSPRRAKQHSGTNPFHRSRSALTVARAGSAGNGNPTTSNSRSLVRRKW